MRSGLRLFWVCTGQRARWSAWLVGAFLLAGAEAFASQPGPEESAFWRISKGDQDAGYVLGTIHSEDPRVLDFSAAFIAQLTSCAVFAMELVPDMPTLSRLTGLMQYPDAETLQHTLGIERYERVMRALEAYQVPADWKVRMKTWAVMMTLSVPVPETGFFMDFSLSLRAAGAGTTVTGLETLEQQLAFMENMPIAYQLVLLDQALSDYQHVDEIHDEMVDVYLSGELSALDRLSDQQFSQLEPGIRDYFLREGIAERNHRMIEKLLPLLQESRVFVAIGALHLPGPDGILALLRDQGYSLEALPMPFPLVAASDGNQAELETGVITE